MIATVGLEVRGGRGAVERGCLVSGEVDRPGGGADGGAGVLDFVGGRRALMVARGWPTSLVTTKFMSISAPDALGLLPP